MYVVLFSHSCRPFVKVRCQCIPEPTPTALSFCVHATQGERLGVESFLLDVAEWLQPHTPTPPLTHHNHHNQQQQQQQQQRQLKWQQQQQQQPQQQQQLVHNAEDWEQGCALVRQAVLWGMPALSTLLVDNLMALPPASLSPSPFAQLAQADTSSASEDGTMHLGGLLHLSLLSPNSTSMMWVVLDWGRRFGGQGGQGRSEEDSASAADRNAAEAGSFAWCWEERNAADQQTPLDLLAALPQGAAAVQHLLEDPLYEPSVQHAKSLARAHCVPPKTSITTTTSLPPSSGKGRASSAGGGGVEGQSAWKLLGWSACESEASYRDWVKAKGVFHMKACSWFNVLHLCTMLVRAFLHEQLHTDLPCLMTLLLPYAVAAFVISIQPKTSEVGGFVSSNVWWVFGSPRDRQTAKDFGRGFLSSCEW